MVQKWRWRKILQTTNLSTKIGKLKGVINPSNSSSYKGNPPNAQIPCIHMVREGIPSYDVLYAALPCYLHKMLFPELEPVTFQSHNNNLRCAKAPPWNVKLIIIYQEKKNHPVENSNRFSYL